MAYAGTDMMELLVSLIIKHLRAEFELKHLTKNLINTIRVEELDDRINIIIPAEVYDYVLFKTKKVIVHTGEGSYASRIDVEGSWNGNHRDYVNRIVNNAIQEWRQIISGDVKVEG